MSDSSYANEYGKWLENSSCTKKADLSDDCYDGNNDNSEECAMNANHDSENEKSANYSYRRNSKLSSGSISDQAPILVDDDDEDDLFTNKKQFYEDEPPVLEPVPDQVQNWTISATENLPFSPQICLRNYSRKKKVISKKHSLKEQNLCNNKDKIITDDDSMQKNSLKSKDIKSGNIFDKFNTENYNCPPPLICSPEALLLYSKLPKPPTKNPNHSPNFRAMEADSTSEISIDKLSISLPQRLSSNSMHEVSIECDSTCSLAASPLIVSPASIYNSEVDENLDAGGDFDIRDEQFESKEFNETSKAKQSALAHTPKQNYLFDDIAQKDVSKIACYDTSSESLIKKLHCDLDQQLNGVSSNLTQDYLFSTIDADNDITDSSFIETHTLSSVSLSSPNSHSGSFNKKHRKLNRSKSYSRSRKRPQVKELEKTNSVLGVMSVVPPLSLDCIPETAATTTITKIRYSRRVSEQSKKNCLNCNQDNTRSLRKQRRCNSVPATGGTDYYNYLPPNLHNFVIGTSLLSDLQTHMHRLLCQLFPQLKLELDTMSPESIKFESLLSDIVRLLEQPDDPNKSAPPFMLCSSESNNIYDHPKQDSVSTQLMSTNKNIKEALSPLLSTPEALVADGFTNSDINPDANSCLHTPSPSSSKLSTCYQPKQRLQVKAPENDEKELVLPLSGLSVRDMEDTLIPSQVLLCRDPKASLSKFVELSCRALQLLLPDLTISLYNELTHSPFDLIILINNVIVANSKR